MRKKFGFIGMWVAVVLVFLSVSAEAQAQEKNERYQAIMPDNSNYISDVHYQAMTEQLIANPKGFSYDQYRKYYITSRFYDPIAADIKEQILNNAYIIQASHDPAEIIEARHHYDALIKDQLANMGVITLVLSLAKKDKRFGNVEFFEEIQDGLFRHVLVSGDGVTLQRAYDVITMEEEVMLLNYLKAKPVNTTSAKEGVWYYNMHDIIDPKTGQAKTIFVNITIPMEYLERQQQNKSRSLNLRNQ